MAENVTDLLTTPELIERAGLMNRRRFNYLRYLYGKLFPPTKVIGTAKLWSPSVVGILKEIDADVRRYGPRGKNGGSLGK